MDFWFNALNNNNNNKNNEEEDEKKEEEEEFFQSPMKPSPPVVVRDEKNANEEEEEAEEEKKSDSRGSSGHHRQSVLSPTTTTSTISTTTGGGYSSEYNSSPETTSELKSKKIGDENDNQRGREGAKVINRRSSTEKYMLTKESFDVTTKEKNGEDDGAEGDDDEGILRDDEQGMRSSILYENPDHTLVEEDEEEREEEEEEEEEEEDVEKEVEVVEKKKKQKKSENNKKKITRVERLREYFKLPPDEELLDEFLCALHKKILLQGRMYVFNNYVCFYSSVFGYQKRKRIPFKDVTLMEKAKTAGIFNNALYIVHQGGKREFFTSFIFPDKVFKFLEQQWRTSSDYGRLFRGHRGHESMDFDATLRRREEQLMLAQLGDSDQSDTEENSEEKKISNMLGTQSWTDTPVNDSELTHEQMKSLRRRRKMSEHRESVEEDTDDLSSDNTATTGENTFEDNEVTSETKRRARTPDLTTSKLYLDRKEDRRKENGGENGEEVANDVETDDFGEIPRMHAMPGDEQDESARIPAECGEGLVSAQFDCTPKEFFKACFSNSATNTFFFAQTKASGMTDFSCTEWAKHSHYGFSRDVKFVAPVNSTFGPKETRCVQTQTYKLYPDDNLIIGYSQVQLDIPYGDYFSVESKWNCVPISSEGDGKMNGCEVTFYVHVVFEKYTYLQSVIQSSVLSETKASAESFLNAAKELLNNKGGVISEEKSASFLERLSKRFSIDVTKVKIPEGSRDAVFSMLYPSAGKDSDAKMRPASTNTHQTTTSSFAKKSTKDKLISGARRAKELAKQFFGLFTIQNLLMFVLFMVVAWTLLAMCASCAQKLWYVVKYPFVVVFGDSDANVEKYWERRITILTQELGALERKVQLVSKEITLAKQSLKKASGS